jgi:hypothetical protein
MNYTLSKRIQLFLPLLCGLPLAALLLLGCQKDNPVSADTGGTALDDAAATVATAIGADNGGAIDQIGDVVAIASAAGLQNEAGALLDSYASDSSYSTVSKTYDSLGGWWTLTLNRHRTGMFGYTELQRTYQYQFLNNAGNFQKYWLTGADTAYAVHFKIISGTGELHTPRLDHHLLSLSGEWMVTGTNTPTVTVNTYNGGIYTRTASDTMKTEAAVRTLNNSLSLTFLDVTGPRRNRFHFATKSSGTITGTYHADITFTRGSLYSEKTIDKTFTITLGGDGTADLGCGGRRFHANLGLGTIMR